MTRARCSSAPSPLTFPLLLILSLLVHVTWAILPPIAVTPPKLAGGTVANDAPPGPFFQDFRPPFPTNTWWAGFGAPPQDAVVAGPAPYASLCTNDGFRFGLSTNRWFDGISIHQDTQLDWLASFSEFEKNFTTHKAKTWDTQTLTIRLFSHSNNATTDIILVPGSPYMTFVYAAATPVFTPTSYGVTAINGVPLAQVTFPLTGTKFKLTSDRGDYLLYSLAGAISLDASADRTSFFLTKKFTGVLRMAKLQNVAHEATLDAHVSAYATGVETDYEFAADGTQADLLFKWTVVGDASKFISLTWPHHRKSIVDLQLLPLTSLGFLTVKGWMYPAQGTTWRLRYKLSAIDFNAPRGMDQSCVPALLRGLEYEVGHLGGPEIPNDFYHWGGKVAAIARLALIAEEVKRPDLRDVVLTALKGTFAPWTNVSYPNVQAAYETGWGSVVNKAAAGSPYIDYGNGYMNDHLFHYGYLLQAGAVIAKLDPSWLTAANGVSTNAEFLHFFARDIINPSKDDPYFPVVRNMDWFAGHSWASGIHNGAGARNQESSSEAVSGYYGALLYAIVTKQPQLERFARLLIAIEQTGSKTYWHLYPSHSETDRDEPYPEPGIRKLVTIGNIQDVQAGAWLFWGDKRVEIAAIQILPVTPVNEELYDAEWVQNMVNYASGELADASSGDEWRSVIFLAYSNYDPHKAAKLSTLLTNWGSGNSYSNQLYFLSTRRNPTGEPICAAEIGNPEGLYALQDVESGLYVTSNSTQPDLKANSRYGFDAALFEMTFVPGGGSLLSWSTGLYVTSSPDATYNVVASSNVPSFWETFALVSAPPTAADGPPEYLIRAGANGRWIKSQATGLINSITAEADASRFRLVAPPAPEGAFLLIDKETGKYVSSTQNDPVLSASALTSGAASTWVVSSGDDNATMQLLSTLQYVSATPSKVDPLSCDRFVASTWETFGILPKFGADGGVSIVALSNRYFVRTAGDGRLVNSIADQLSSSTFRLVRPSNPVGRYFLQDVETKLYLSATSASPRLTANSRQMRRGTLFTGGYDGLIRTEASSDCLVHKGDAVNLSPANGTCEPFLVSAKALSVDEYTISTSDANFAFVTGADGLISSRPVDSSNIVASAYRVVVPAAPEGTFALQAANGKYISAAPILTATESSPDNATWFRFSSDTSTSEEYHTVSLQSVTTQQFVTCDPGGDQKVAALRPTAMGWEQFTVLPRSGSGDEYVLKASVNDKFLVVDDDGFIWNRANTYNEATGFRIIGSQNPVGQYYLRDLASGLYVSSTNAREVLIADATAPSLATTFNFDLLEDGLFGSIQSANTKLFVTVDPNGLAPAIAARPSPSAWEQWVVSARPGSPLAYTLQSTNNDRFVVSRPSGLFNNATDVKDASLFVIIPVPA